MLFIAMFTREKSFNQLLEKIHKRKKYKNMFGKKEHIPKSFEERYEKDGELKTDTIYVASTLLNLKNETINKIIHARWDIENNGFQVLKIKDN